MAEWSLASDFGKMEWHFLYAKPKSTEKLTASAHNEKRLKHMIKEHSNNEQHICQIFYHRKS